MSRAYKTTLVAGIAVLVLVALRAALPAFVESYVNDRLADLGEYRGEVAEIDLSLWRGAYVVRDLRIVKRGSRFDEPFLDVERMDLSLQWPALLEAEIAGQATLYGPVLNLIQAETDDDSQLGTEVDWAQRFSDLFPFSFNSFEAVDGTVTFRAPGIEADESMTLQDLQLEMLNLTNVEGAREDAFAHLELSGRVMGEAPLLITGRIAPNESLPTFDIDLSLEEAEIARINPWLREFLNVDAETGTFFLYTELAGAEGSFDGYLKPILEDPSFLDLDDESQGPFRKAWEGLVQVAAEVLENQEEGQVATQIPFSGEIEDPEAGLLPAMVNLLKNAFVAGFSRSLEGTITLDDAGEENGQSEQDGSDND